LVKDKQKDMIYSSSFFQGSAKIILFSKMLKFEKKKLKSLVLVEIFKNYCLLTSKFQKVVTR